MLMTIMALSLTIAAQGQVETVDTATASMLRIPSSTCPTSTVVNSHWVEASVTCMCSR